VFSVAGSTAVKWLQRWEESKRPFYPTFPPIR
jgi:hypothetical protein